VAGLAVTHAAEAYMKKKIDRRDLAAVFENSASPACVMKPILKEGRLVDLRILEFNRAFMRLCRAKKHGLVPNALVSEVISQDLDSMMRASEQVLRKGKPRTMRLYLAGVAQWRRCTFGLSDSGNVVAILTEIEDGERAKGKDGGSGLFKDFFESGGIKLILRTSDGRIIGCNRAACAFYGWSKRRLKAMSIGQISLSSKEAIERQTAIVEARGLSIFHTCHRVAGGEVKSVEVHAYLGRYKGENVHFAVVLDRLDPSGGQGVDIAKIEAKDLCSAREGDFKAFIERYQRDLPYVRFLVRQILPYGRLINYKNGEHFLEYGGVNSNAGFLLDGLFRQYTLGPEGTDCTLKLLGPGEILFVSPSRGRGPEAGLALEAITECRVFLINGSHFGPVIDADIRWSKLFYRTCAETISGYVLREYSLLCEDASERYRRFLKEDGHALPHMRSYDIASYLGIAAETLSRIRKQMAGKAGVRGRPDRPGQGSAD
jgi:PAS domain S-box-containing protein